MLWIVLALLLGAFALAALLTGLVRALGVRHALLDSPGAAEHHKPVLRPVPNIGGIAIFWTITLILGAGLAAGWILTPDRIAHSLPFLAPISIHLAGMRTQTPMALALIGCLAALHVMGLIDDRRPIGAPAKLLVMVAAAGVMVLAFHVRLLELLDAPAGGTWASIIITIIWLVAITNAVNFLDNMDGVAAGVGVVAGACFLATAILHGQWFVALTLALLVGALAGFLLFNRPRATIFMGDAGSLVVGFLLAFLTVRTTYREGPEDPWYALFMPLCVLAVPLYDLLTVSAIRLAQGKSPFVGDQQHFTHRLRARGLSDWRVLGVICGLTAITGLSGIVLAQVHAWPAALVGAQVLLTLAVLAFYEHGASRARADA